MVEIRTAVNFKQTFTDLYKYLVSINIRKSNNKMIARNNRNGVNDKEIRKAEIGEWNLRYDGDWIAIFIKFKTHAFSTLEKRCISKMLTIFHSVYHAQGVFERSFSIRMFTAQASAKQ